jgi:hypothetical protein
MVLSQAFIETILTLILPILLTGLLIPFVFKIRDEQKLKEQKRFEADVERQSKIIEAQVQLLENLATLLWEFQMLAVAVPYFRQFDKDIYTSAASKYNQNSPELIGRIRAEISKSLRLVPNKTFESLKHLYYDDILYRADLELTSLIKDKSDKWSEFHNYILRDFAVKIDTTIDSLAIELKLKSNDMEGHASEATPRRRLPSIWHLWRWRK